MKVSSLTVLVNTRNNENHRIYKLTFFLFATMREWNRSFKYKIGGASVFSFDRSRKIFTYLLSSVELLLKFTVVRNASVMFVVVHSTFLQFHIVSNRPFTFDYILVTKFSFQKCRLLRCLVLPVLLQLLEKQSVSRHYRMELVLL